MAVHAAWRAPEGGRSAQTLKAIRGPGDSLPSGADDKSRSEAAGVLERSKGPVALRPSSSCRDDEGDRGVQSPGGGEHPIVLKFTGVAIDLDSIKSRPCCRAPPPAAVCSSLRVMSIASFVVRSFETIMLSLDRNRAVHSRVL